MGITNGGLISSSSKTTQQETLALSDGLACFTGSFSGVTTTSISHGLNSTDLVVEFKDSLGNLLIPDTWSITNPNVIEAEFTPAATGDVVIIACIESGLAPITGGVVLLEGLSGIIDLDCPNDSIDISTSGQVINICAIFTSESGALLEQKCRDIDILSGLIGGGSGNPVDSRPATGVITPDADCVYDLGTELARWRALYACSGLFRDAVGIGTSEPDPGLHVSGLPSLFERDATEAGQSVVKIDANAAGFGQVEALHINYETGAQSGIGAAVLVNVDNTEAEGGAVAALAVLSASGENRTVGLATGPRVDPILQFIGSELTSSAMTVGSVDGVDELSDLQDPDISTFLFVDDGDDLLIGSDEQFGEIFVDLDLGAGKDLRTLFEYSTGVGTFLPFLPLDGTDGFQIGGSIVWSEASTPGFTPGTGGNFLIRMTRNRSGNIQGAPLASQISIALNTVTQIDSYFWDKDGSVRIRELGVRTTTFPNARNAIETSGNIQTSGHVNPFGDCVYDLGTTEDRWANLNACSGTFSERPTVNGSGVLLIGEATAGGEIDTQTSINGLSGTLTLKGVSGIQISESGQSICVAAESGGITQIIQQVGFSGLFGGVLSVNTADQSTNSAVFIEALSMTITTSGGVYRLGWTVEGEVDSDGKTARYQVQLDDATTLMTICPSFTEEDSPSVFSSFDYQPLSEGTHTIDLDFAVADTGVINTIRRARLEAWRVGDLNA